MRGAMPVEYAVLPQRNLVLFTYRGDVGLTESAEAIAAAARDPAYRSWMRQLCDLSQVTGYERNFPELLKMQARIVDDLMPPGQRLTVLFYAPSRIGQEMALMARKSWEGLDAVVVLIQDNETAALEMLGLPERQIRALAVGVRS